MGQQLTKEVTINGILRTYTYYVPTVPQNPAPTVFGWHGSGDNFGFFLSDQTGWKRLAEREGFIMVAPQGDPAPDVTWYATTPTADGSTFVRDDELRLTEAILAQLAADHGSLGSAYCTGFSGGATLAWRLAADLPVWAGVAPANGWIARRKTGGPWLSLPHTGTAQMRVWGLWGERDTVTPDEGGQTEQPEYEGISATAGIDAWALHLGVSLQGVCPSVAVLPAGTYWGYASSGLRAQGHVEGARGHSWPTWAAPEIWKFWTQCPT